MQNFAEWPHAMPDMGHDYLSYALGQWSLAATGSSLHDALAAFSLAIFGRTRRSDAILEQAEGFYAQSIIKTLRETRDLPNSNIDQLIIATLLMTTYEVSLRGLIDFDCSLMFTNGITEHHVWCQEVLPQGSASCGSR